MSSKSQDDIDGIPIKIRISDDDWKKIITYCRIAKPNEIMGMARVRETENGLEIYNPFILKQKVGPATCEFDRADFARFMGACEDIKFIKCIWHSHVNMSAFFSSCDRGTSEGMAALGRTMGGASSWFLSVVVNLRQEYQAKLDIFKPTKVVLPGELYRFEGDIDTVASEEVKQKLEEERYVSSTPSHGSHPHSYSPPYREWKDEGYTQQDLDDLMSGRSEGHIWTPPKKQMVESPEHEEVFDVIKRYEEKKKQENGHEGPGKSGC